MYGVLNCKRYLPRDKIQVELQPKFSPCNMINFTQEKNRFYTKSPHFV